jgi:dihydrofolate reductase
MSSSAIYCHTDMANVIYSMTTSLDGFIAGPDGDFSWSAPDAELHAFHNEQTRGLSAHLCGRNLYETMVYWEREDESRDAVAREFAEIWRPLPKIVFSTTLTEVEGNARLATGTLAEELAKLDGDVGVGGAGLAASCFEPGLVDEVHIFVYPVILGGGTPFLPPVRLDLSMVEARTFGGKVTHVRYRRAH